MQIKYEPQQVFATRPPQSETQNVEQKIYCSCQQQLEGEMIECENPDVCEGCTIVNSAGTSGSILPVWD